MTPYQYVNNNPIMFTDPTGMSAEPPSTHIDEEGNVIGVFDDGDNGLYQHRRNADGGIPTEYQLSVRQKELGTSAGGKKVGDTITPLGFADFSAYTEGKVTAAPGAKIDLNSTWATDKVSDILGSDPISAVYAYKARGGQEWDIKTKTPNDNIYYGSKLFGSYASARDAGNFVAGAVAQMSMLPNSFFDYGFGVYNLSGNNIEKSLKMIGSDLLMLSSGSPGSLSLGRISMQNKAQYGEHPLSRAGIEAGKKFIQLLQKK